MKAPFDPVKKTILTLLLAGSFSLTAWSEAKVPGPFFEGLGNTHHPVTTTSKTAQRYFDQGLRFLYGFNHAEAIRSFRSAAKVDPDCAMAWWGVACAHGPHVNKPMNAEDNVRAWEALQQARALAAKVSRREQAYIQALSRRYEAEFREDRSALDRAYADAMRDLVKQYPDDLDAQALFAEALLDTMPWDYWLTDRTPKPETEEAFAALRLVLARDPDHPGANHFYIHAVEAGPNPEWGLPAADSLARTIKTAGHLVHMPAHIYMRVGQYADAVTANERAVKADQSYIRQCAAQGFYPGAYYPHNLHFLWYALVFEGRSREAQRAADKVARFAQDNYCGPRQAVEGPRLRHLPQLTAARFGRWAEVLQAPAPSATNDFLVDRAMWHYCRGLAFAAQADVGGAEAEQRAFRQLRQSDEAKELDSPYFPVTGTLAVADHLLAGKIAGARGESAGMIAALERAVASEDALPYMEPAFWPYPTRPALAAALLVKGEAARAEQVFREDLARWPRNGWSLFGLEQTLRAQDKGELADVVQRQFQTAWQRADVTPDLKLY